MDTASVKPADWRGVYTAERAAALSGVPKSTVHYWDRRAILVPSVSAERVRLWSYTDLMGLRTIYWLRQPKLASDGWDVPRTAMPAIKRALAKLRELDVTLWTEDGTPRVMVDRGGEIYLRTDNESVETTAGARPLSVDWLDLIEPFTTRETTEGPNLQSPRPHLRIVPGKLSGSPHIASTRIETLAIFALRRRGVDDEGIHHLYPVVAPMAIAEAIDLERQLQRNLKVAA